MAPLITTSLREYAMENVRTYERSLRLMPSQFYFINTTARDEWLALQDWTESADALQPFDDLMDSIDSIARELAAYIEKHDLGDATDHPLNRVAETLEEASWQADDCRSIITNIQRKDGAK